MRGGWVSGFLGVKGAGLHPGCRDVTPIRGGIRAIGGRFGLRATLVGDMMGAEGGGWDAGARIIGREVAKGVGGRLV